ncbi:hypothetical protein BT69DRAFT_1336917 [Atractiella rhizophila]|nr:hypothetical protein BT69DRAFT_1336917 [Atractiella rhizophila]
MLSVGEVSGLINAALFIVQGTIGLAIVLSLVAVLRSHATAVSWSTLARTLHSSAWPDLLSTDSAHSKSSDRRVGAFSWLAAASWVLITVAGITTPIGLDVGIIDRSAKTVNTRYVRDNSPTGNATSSRDGYQSGRVCSSDGGWGAGACPGQSSSTGIMPQNITEKFTGEHSTMTLQFRNFYSGYYSNMDQGAPLAMGYLAQADNYLLRNDIFAIEGAVIDMGERPGIGFLNHTFPDIKNDGAIWTRDVLWIEPVTQCTNTNLTLDYTTTNQPVMPDNKTLVDHGGWYNLAHDYPEFDEYRDGQHIPLAQHSYKAAWTLNAVMMASRNLTRNATHEGYAMELTKWNFTLPGQLKYLEFSSAFSLADGVEERLNISASSLTTICQGYGGADYVNLTNVAVSCSYIIGPPTRMDHGDQNRQQANVTWSQPIHVCASTTRMAIQTLEFSYNGTDQNVSNLKIKRDPENIKRNVLWGMENLNGWLIGEIDPVYGRINDQWENDPDLFTYRADWLYVPAGSSDIWGTSDLQASAMFGQAWSTLHTSTGTVAWNGGEDIFQYGGTSSYALMAKWQNYYLDNLETAPERISNLIFSNIAANNVVGTSYADKLTITAIDKTITYKIVWAIPAFLLLALWTPLMLYAIFVLVTGKVKLEYFRYLLNQTSVGRIVTGDSDLRTVRDSANDTTRGFTSAYTEKPFVHSPISTPAAVPSLLYDTPHRSDSQSQMKTKEWSKLKGEKTILALTNERTESFREPDEGNTLLRTVLHNVHQTPAPSLENVITETPQEEQWWNRKGTQDSD